MCCRVHKGRVGTIGSPHAGEAGFAHAGLKDIESFGTRELTWCRFVQREKSVVIELMKLTDTQSAK